MKCEHAVGERVGKSLTVIPIETAVRIKAIESENHTLRSMIGEALIEWKAWAKDKLDLDADPGPDGQKYRKISGLFKLMPMSEFEKAMTRPKDFFKLGPNRQWEIDKSLGILDWDGNCGHGPKLCDVCKKRFKTYFGLKR